MTFGGSYDNVSEVFEETIAVDSRYLIGLKGLARLPRCELSYEII